MTKDNSFRRAWHYLKLAQEYFNDVAKQNPNKVAGSVSKSISDRITWQIRDFKTDPRLPTYASDDFSTELDTDALSIETIAWKLLNCSPAQRDVLESVIDDLIAGVKVTVQIS